MFRALWHLIIFLSTFLRKSDDDDYEDLTELLLRKFPFPKIHMSLQAFSFMI